MGGVGNGAAEEDWRWDLNPGTAPTQVRPTQLWREWGATCLWDSLCHAAWEAGKQDVAAMGTTPLQLGRMQERAVGRKGVKGLLPVGQVKVPHGFGLRTGDPSNTADGAGTRGRPASRARITGKKLGLPEPQTTISFPEIQYPRLGKGGEGRTVCVSGCFKGLWDFNEDIKSLL